MPDLVTALSIKSYPLGTQPLRDIPLPKRIIIEELAYFGLCNPAQTGLYGITSATSVGACIPDIDEWVDKVRDLSDSMARMLLQPFESAVLNRSTHVGSFSGIFPAVVIQVIPDGEVIGADFRILDESQTADEFVVEAEAEQFISAKNLESDFSFVKDRIKNIFHPEKVTVSLISGSDDEAESDERLLFLIRCTMDRKTFRANCEHCYQPLRNEMCAIYTQMSILRDL